MRVLIAIKSCNKDAARGCHRAIRETWGAEVEGADLRFFVGEDPLAFRSADTIVLPNCPDDYAGLPQKTRAILAWSINHGYDFTFLCDTDTFLIPPRLLACGFENYDLTGCIGGNLEGGKYFPWPSGGAGYFLSQKAAWIVALSKTIDTAEDRMIGQILLRENAEGNPKSLNHPGFHRVYPDDPLRCDVTLHFDGRGAKQQTYDPKWMYEVFAHNRGLK